MTPNDFDTQVRRLRAAYGPQMHDEFVALLWRRVGDRDSLVFEKAVDQIIEERALLKMSIIVETLNAKEKSYFVESQAATPRSDEPVKASALNESIRKQLRIISGGR